MGFGVGLTSDLISVITKPTAAGNSCHFSVGVQAGVCRKVWSGFSVQCREKPSQLFLV